MSTEKDGERLYGLIPEVYRNRDVVYAGQPLRALMAVMEHEYAALRGGADEMYDALFIETCAAWAVPYLGELVGVRGADDAGGAIPTARARVANAIRLTRGKGTAWVLAQAARDATGWPARAVELFERMAVTQSLADVRSRRGGTARVSGVGRMAAVGTPFDGVPHNATVRTADDGGLYGLAHVGLYLWRLRGYPLARAEPRAHGAGRFTFSPFGARTPLFTAPRREPPPGVGAGPWDVPQPFTRELLHQALAALRGPWRGDYPPVAVWAGPAAGPLAPLPVRAADLSGWDDDAPPAPADGAVEVDPELGRLRFGGGEAPAVVRVAWTYGFPGEIGGGPYPRDVPPAPPGAWHAAVGGGSPHAAGGAGGEEGHATLAGALRAWAARGGAEDGVITLRDSALHPLAGVGAVAVPAGRTLRLVAAPGEAPCLAGDLHVHGGDGAGLEMSGVWLDGTLHLRGNLAASLADCTVAPPAGGGVYDRRRSVAGAPGSPGLVLTAQRCVLGPVALPGESQGVALFDSVVGGGVWALSGGAGDHESGPAPAAHIERCTLLGIVEVREVEAADSIFADPLWAVDPERGSLTCCSLPGGSRAPRRFRCAGAPAPLFTSTRWGDPGFAQLAAGTPSAISAGARDGAEMGAWHDLQQPRREQGLRAALDEFLPAWSRAVVLHAT
jgi:hypothetical protein